MTPDEMLETLKADASKRKRESLDVIHAVCQEQMNRGSPDFSYATIGRLSEQQGGPKGQSIRNKSGEAYQALIKAWADYAGGTSKRKKRAETANKDSEQELLDQIGDQAVKAVVGRIMAEKRKLEGQVRTLKAQSNVVVDLRAQKGPQPAPKGDSPVEVQTKLELTDSERQALEDAISDELFEKEGWTADKHGRVKNANNRPLFKPGFVTAIQKALKASENG